MFKRMDWLFNQYNLPEVSGKLRLWTPQEVEETDSFGIYMELKAALPCYMIQAEFITMWQITHHNVWS